MKVHRWSLKRSICLALVKLVNKDLEPLAAHLELLDSSLQARYRVIDRIHTPLSAYSIAGRSVQLILVLTMQKNIRAVLRRHRVSTRAIDNAPPHRSYAPYSGECSLHYSCVLRSGLEHMYCKNGVKGNKRWAGVSVVYRQPERINVDKRAFPRQLGLCASNLDAFSYSGL